MMFEPRRIHPIGIILNLISVIKSYVVPAVFLFFFGKNVDFNIYFILGAILLVTSVIVISILDWLKFTYRVEDGEVRIEHGIFVKKKRYIPIERIQTINISAGIIQQLFKLVKVQIETASGGIKAEAELIAVKRVDAESIEKAIASYKQEKAPVQIEEDGSVVKQLPTYKMTKKELLVAASTSSGVGVILSAIAAFFSQFEEFIPYEKIFDQFEFLTNASITVYISLVFIAFLITWIISVIGVILKYAHFTVIKDEKEIKISKGIFEKQQLSIPLSRIQAIRIVQNPIRQLLGYSTIHIETAGGSVGDNDTSTILFPVVSSKIVKSLLSEYLPDFEIQESLNVLPQKSKKRYVTRKLLIALIPVVLLSYYFMPWGLFSLIILPISLYWGYCTFKDAGWIIIDNQLNLRYRFISKTMVLIKRNKIQSIKGKTTYFQKRNQLQTVSISIKSGLIARQFTIKDMNELDVDEIMSWYI
ncbi:PH domain-containing protein [Metabacillus malikii]|uniref:Membrane protein n=1 Tax=Metabacillus malikii TaxID=1504265 RepID=A0ABT9ZJN1_9BACI|nr:PH domain-containing protein [Metabacillus malikii]MDQ0232496.1 putative membrane protein [Metabacillus malikii]